MHLKIKKVLSLLLCTAFTVSLCACSSAKKKTLPDNEYFENVSAYGFWQNKGVNSVPEYVVYHHINDFFADAKIVNGQAITEDGKIKKVLFLGYDGMRADALLNVLIDENADKENLNPAVTKLSGINELRKTGGLYMAYCGGEKGKDNQQTTSTSASWTSQFTGVWGNKHGVVTNDDSKNLEYKTFMTQYAEKGLSASIAFDWDPYFDVNLKEEVKYVMNHPNIDMTFCDIDRAKSKKLKKDSAETLELFNFTAPETPCKSTPFDSGIRDYVLKRIEQGDDVVCGIYHNIDTMGHTYEFSNNSPQYVNAVITDDIYSYQIINEIKEREKKYNEQWLIIFANDHGGIGAGHGEQSLEERTTWIASNVKLDEKYYSSNYNGYCEK